MSLLGFLGSTLFPVLGGIAGNAIAPGVGGAIGSALGSAVGGSVSHDESNKESTQQQMEYAKYQADLEQANWQKRFDAQNAYNDPSAMRERLRNAGMNANLAYGSLSPNMAANPSAGMPTGQLSKYQTAIETSLAMQQLQNERRRVENETKVADSTAEKNTAEAGKARAEERRAGVSADQIGIENEMMREARRVIGYNPYIQSERNSDFKRSLDVADFNLRKMLGERAADLELDKFSHQQIVDLTHINIAMARLELEKQVSASQVQSNLAAAFMMSAQGMLAKANENGVWLDNGMKVIDLNYHQFNTFLDVVGKMNRNELTAAQTKETIARTLNISIQSADILMKRAQSLVKQYVTFGLTY